MSIKKHLATAVFGLAANTALAQDTGLDKQVYATALQNDIATLRQSGLPHSELASNATYLKSLVAYNFALDKLTYTLDNVSLDDNTSCNTYLNLRGRIQESRQALHTLEGTVESMKPYTGKSRFQLESLARENQRVYDTALSNYATAARPLEIKCDDDSSKN